MSNVNGAKLILKQTTMKINDNWSVIRDENNSILTHIEEKERKNKVSGNKEKYLSKTEYFYPNLHSALKRYLMITLDQAQDIKDCVVLIEKTLKEIEKAV